MSSITTRTAVEDYRTLREAAAPLDLSAWTVLRLRGPDMRAFLQGLATQDLDGDPVSGPYETLFLNEKGRPIALAWVSFDEAGDSAWIVADEGSREVLPPHLERFRIMEEVEWEGPEGMPHLIGFGGPDREKLLHDMAAKNEDATAILATPISFLLLPSERSTGRPQTAHHEAFEAWRLSIGLPRTGIDFDTARIATELSLPEAISLTKGCYVGQEVVARTSHRGNVRRRRVGFRFTWSGAPIPPGAEIRVGDQAAGFVTSSAPEPGSEDGLGMGYLASEIPEGEPYARVVKESMTFPLRISPWPL